MKYLVIFYTFSGVMQLERLLKKKTMFYETMPAPRKLSTDCGVAIVFDCDNIQAFLEEVNTTNIHRVYHMNENEYELVYENH